LSVDVGVDVGFEVFVGVVVGVHSVKLISLDATHESPFAATGVIVT